MTSDLHCEGARDDFPAALYGELSAERRARLDEHLATCAGCRAEWSGLQETHARLDAWALDLDELGETDARELAASVRRSARPSGRRVAVLVGLAAAAVAFALLTVAGAEVSVGADRVTVAFAWPSGTAPATDPQADPEAEARERILDELRTELLARLEDERAELARAQTARFETWDAAEQARRLAFAHDLSGWIDGRLARESERVALVLADLHRGTVERDELARDAFQELASLVAVNRPPDRPTPDDSEDL